MSKGARGQIRRRWHHLRRAHVTANSRWETGCQRQEDGRWGLYAECVGPTHRARAGQHVPARQVVVEEEPEADHPDRSHAGVVGHHETQRPQDVGRAFEQYLALGQRLAHQQELAVLEVAQAAMDELGGRRGGVAVSAASTGPRL